jgi:hypothetical protein
MLTARILQPALIGVGLLCAVSGCDDLWRKVTGHRLSRGHHQGDELGAHAPAPDGPKLGILADFTGVCEDPDRNSRRLGWLHAGAKVARAEHGEQNSSCPGGWYAIYPRGFVCAGTSATLDLKHPTLAAMGLAPKLNEPLPYPYAEARVATEVFVPNNEPEASVHSVARLRPAATFAVVGSWQAMDETDQRQRLALMTGGTFVRADDLRAAETATSSGVSLDSAQLSLPLAFIVADRAKSWRLEGDQALPLKQLGKGTTWHVGSRPRSLGATRYYSLDDGAWVQESDVTVVRLRNNWPAFVSSDRHWVDVNLDDNTVVLYSGQHPAFATLMLGSPKQNIAKFTGETEVIAKYVTDKQLDPRSIDSNHEVYDVPWVVELSNGLMLHAAIGRERKATVLRIARVELAPSDARFVWNWVEPTLPAGWHGVSASDHAEHRTPVLVR